MATKIDTEVTTKTLPEPGPLVWAALLFTVFSWGSSFTVAKYAMQQLTPISLATLRFTLAALFFIPVLIVGRRWRQIALADVPKLSALAFLGVTSYFWVQYAGVSRTSATNASLLITTAPIFVMLLSALFYQDKVGRRKWAGIVVAFLGSTLIITRGQSLTLLNNDYLIGNALMIFNAFCWALFTISSKQIMKKYDPLLVTAFITVAGSLFFIPLAVRDNLMGQLGNVSIGGWASVVFLGLFCSVGGYLGWNYALSRLSSTSTAVFLYIQPLITAVTAVFLVEENITIFLIVGGILIICGVFITSRK